MADYTFHLIANAHLDPVWLWDWHEGLNEGLITCRTILDLMDEVPELTFVRGESAIYQHIERTDPVTFRRIVRQVKAGRWDVVGGTVVQPDTNLPATETLFRQFVHGQRYFRQRFGKTARVAWSADSFGHAEGLPEILAAAGITAFAFTRPPASIVPIDKPAFWWEGPGGSRVLAYRPTVGWYGSDRVELSARLEQTLAEAPRHGLHHVGLFYGLGNHGGGPTRAMLRQIADFAHAHPNIRVLHSGLHRFFDALRREVLRKSPAQRSFIPTHRGEMNFVLRGCYSSVARFKFPYRRTEALLAHTERSDTVIRSALRQRPADLRDAWDALLFNGFHDILPGTSIERAYVDQLAWLGGAYHRARAAELDALNALAARVDTRVTPPKGDQPSAVAALVWNPHPWPFDGHVELEAALDYRPIEKYYGRPDAVPVQVLGPDREPLPFQLVQTEHLSTPRHAWRKRALVALRIPPGGWTTLQMGWVENPRLAGGPRQPVRGRASEHAGEISNGPWRVTARSGAAGIHFLHQGKRLFGTRGLSAVVYDDPFGSWGEMSVQPQSNLLRKVRETWKIEKLALLESGPLRAALWVRLSGRRSWIELTIRLSHGRDAADVSARVLWNECAARLKLVMPGARQAEYDVPGGAVRRGACGEVPGGRWARVRGARAARGADAQDGFGFASDGLYNFDIADGSFQATVARATRYAASDPQPADERPWEPAVDAGELTFRFLLTPPDAAPQGDGPQGDGPQGDGPPGQLVRLAAELESPPSVLLVPPRRGDLPRSGSLVALEPASLDVLAIKPAEQGSGVILRLREASGSRTRPRLRWLGQRLELEALAGHQIGTWRLVERSGRWRARREPAGVRAG